MPVGRVITRRYYGLLHVYYAVTSIYIIDYTYSNKQQTQLTYLNDALKQPSSESECHVYTRDHPVLLKKILMAPRMAPILNFISQTKLI